MAILERASNPTDKPAMICNHLRQGHAAQLAQMTLQTPSTFRDESGQIRLDQLLRLHGRLCESKQTVYP